MPASYDALGKGYINKRRSDPRIASLLHSRLGDAHAIVNIGAGAGSYEPSGRAVVAVEPSMNMIAQRPPASAPAVQANAEALPFADHSFDLAMGLLTLHHWRDWQRGLREAMRVARGQVLLLTWFDTQGENWLTDYFPELAELDKAQFPAQAQYEEVLGELEVVPVPIPHDCQDGFLYAYWRRPEAYLDPAVRQSISSFHRIKRQEEGLGALERDLTSGRWLDRYGHLLAVDACDFGYRLVRAGV